MLAGTVYLFKTMPTGFIPSQDSGFMFGVTQGPPGYFVRLDEPRIIRPWGTSFTPTPMSGRLGAFTTSRQSGILLRQY